MTDAAEVPIYVFSSESITNIWAGFGARTWAVSIREKEESNAATKTKAAKIAIGSFGLLYCTPWHSFTVPFVFQATPKVDEIETEIWHGEWMAPFRFLPLGSPRRKFPGVEITKLPGAQERKIANYSHYLHVQSTFAFQRSSIAAKDWQRILELLSE